MNKSPSKAELPDLAHNTAHHTLELLLLLNRPFDFLVVSALLSSVQAPLRLATAVIAEKSLAGTVLVELLRLEDHLVADTADGVVIFLLPFDGLGKVLQSSGDLELDLVGFVVGGDDLDFHFADANGVAGHDGVCEGGQRSAEARNESWR